MKECKLPLGTVIISSVSQKVIILNYLMSCNNINNKRRYNGSGSANFGVDKGGSIGYTTDFSPDKTITYAEFQELIAEPTEPVVINQYDIF